MEVIMNNYLCLGLIALCALALGFVFGRWGMKRHCDGWIIIEPTEDHGRERLIWKLDMELDDIRTRTQIIFRVADNVSKKSQSV